MKLLVLHLATYKYIFVMISFIHAITVSRVGTCVLRCGLPTVYATCRSPAPTVLLVSDGLLIQVFPIALIPLKSVPTSAFAPLLFSQSMMPTPFYSTISYSQSITVTMYLFTLHPTSTSPSNVLPFVSEA